jgi:hypothetical protein
MVTESQYPGVATPRFFSMRLIADIGIGLRYGVGMAVFFSALSVVSWVLSQVTPFATLHMTWLQGISCYFISGTLAGIAAGVLRPIGQWAFGSVVIGAVAGGITGTVFTIGEFGQGGWTARNIGFVVLLTVFGAVMGPILRTKIRAARALG